jgi:hypothetical protein
LRVRSAHVEAPELEETLSRFRPVLAVLTAIAALGTAPPAASADLIEPCPPVELEQPFVPWLDPMDYTLIPGATFEQGARGWELSDARVVDGNEPFYVHGEGERRSLALAPGGAALSPTVCAGLQEPTLRFFARAVGGDGGSALVVEALAEDQAGGWQALTIAFLLARPGWQVSGPHPVLANLLALLPGDHVGVAFRLRALGAAAWQVDDVYLDPQYRN